MFPLLTFQSLPDSCSPLSSKFTGSPLKHSTWSELSSTCWRGTVCTLQPSLQLPEGLAQSKRPRGQPLQQAVQGPFSLVDTEQHARRLEGEEKGLLHRRMHPSAPLLLSKCKLSNCALALKWLHFRVLWFGKLHLFIYFSICLWEWTFSFILRGMELCVCFHLKSEYFFWKLNQVRNWNS